MKFEQFLSLNEGYHLDYFGIFDSDEYDYYKATNVSITDKLPIREINKYVNSKSIKTDADVMYTYNENKDGTFDVYVLLPKDDAKLLKSINQYDFVKTTKFYHNGKTHHYGSWYKV